MKRLSLFLLPLLFNCAGEVANEYDGIKHNDAKNIQMTELNVDSVNFDGKEISMTGLWSIRGDKMLFLDRFSPQIVQYDLNGNYENVLIRNGRGPNEIVNCGLFAAFSDGNDFMYIDGQSCLNIINSQNEFVKKDLSVIDFGREMTTEQINDLINNPDPNSEIMYEINFGLQRFLNIDGKKILFPIVSEHPKFNAFDTSIPNYWADALTLNLFNIESGKNEKIFGHYPPYFKTNKVALLNAPNFCSNSNGEILLNYQPDPIIYVRDNNGVLLRSFGVGAKALENIEYPIYNTFQENVTNELKAEKWGYYTSIISVGDYVVRTYKKHKTAGGGIQIYKNETLIGEFDLASAPYIAGVDNESNIWLNTPADEENEIIKFYKFKIK